jgi:hypothetical protein
VFGGGLFYRQPSEINFYSVFKDKPFYTGVGTKKRFCWFWLVFSFLFIRFLF